jgi:hypothetical protein
MNKNSAAYQVLSREKKAFEEKRNIAIRIYSNIINYCTNPL